MRSELPPIETVMDPEAMPHEAAADSTRNFNDVPNWLYNLQVLWQARIFIARIACCAFVISAIVVFLIPKMYVSQTCIMPPETSNSGSALLAALAGHDLQSQALGGLALSLMGGHNTGALFIDLLRSGSVTSPLIDRFELQKVYHKRYHGDAAKMLARRTDIAEDKKSGVITLSVHDTDPQRARDMAQAYLDELNVTVTRTSRFAAHQERAFIEKRLAEVQQKLSHAQQAMSEFASTHTAIDLKAQAAVTVESQAKLQGELIVAQSELESLQQIYGDGNVRVRAADARIGELKRELAKMGGSSAPLPATGASTQDEDATSYLPLRQVPRLAVPYADLYRELRVQETVYDLLTQQYEIARIQEAKDIPTVNIIDAPGIPEKKSFPPRALLTLVSTLVIVLASCAILLGLHFWRLIDPNDPRRLFAQEVARPVRSLRRVLPRRKEAS
jgi:capsule polysaccharide export protein KpsE/RkpR